MIIYLLLLEVIFKIFNNYFIYYLHDLKKKLNLIINKYIIYIIKIIKTPDYFKFK